MANDNDKNTQMQNILKRQRERAKTGKPSTVGGQTELPKGTTPAGTPATGATETGPPTRLNPPTGPPPAPLQSERRPVGAGTAGKLTKVKAAPAKKDLTASTLGGTKQPTPSQMGVSAKTGKTKEAGPGYWQRLKKYATRAERKEIPADTMQKRLTSIGRTAERGMGGFGKGRKPGGQINVEAMRQRQQTFPGLRADEQSLSAPQGRKPVLSRAGPPGTKRYRDKGGKPGSKEYMAKLSPAIKGQRGVGPIKQTEPGRRGEYYGKFTGEGEKAPVVVEKQEARVEKAPVTRKAPVTPKKELSWWEKAKQFGRKVGTEFQKAGKEMTAEAQRSTAPSGKYGTKEQAQKGAKAVKKVVVPKTFKEK